MSTLVLPELVDKKIYELYEAYDSIQYKFFNLTSPLEY